MKLSYRVSGTEEAPPLVILHGLLGSSRNWVTVAKQLSSEYRVYLLDLRNHGDSPHSDAMDFAVMVDDLHEFFEVQSIKTAHLIGHSLGGKTAMRFACTCPERVTSLTVADIAPKDYGLHFQGDFNAMLELDLPSFESRKAIDDALEVSVSDWAHRQFLLSNLKREKDGNYAWSANIPVLAASLGAIRKNSLDEGAQFSGPTCFITGADSDFVQPEDKARIVGYFPEADIVEIPNAGHNVHFDQTEAFLREWRAFVAGI